MSALRSRNLNTTSSGRSGLSILNDIDRTEPGILSIVGISSCTRCRRSKGRLLRGDSDISWVDRNENVRLRAAPRPRLRNAKTFRKGDKDAYKLQWTVGSRRRMRKAAPGKATTDQLWISSGFLAEVVVCGRECESDDSTTLSPVELSGPGSGSSATSLRQRIASLSAQIEALSNERDVAQAELESISYPILTLPTEITIEIFQSCLPSDAVKPSPTGVPLIFGRICRQWRNIALATPRLWSSVDISGMPGSSTGNALLCTFLKTWLARSASHPLTFTWDDTAKMLYSDSTNALHDTVLRHAHRWRDVILALTHADLVRYMSVSEGFPLLEKLTLYPTESGAHASHFTALRVCPRLEHLLTDGSLLHSIPQHFPLWSQLTRFHGRNVSLSQGWDVLTFAVGLECCTLRFHDNPSVTDLHPHRTPSTLSRLRELWLMRETRKTLCEAEDLEVLRFLTLPALDDLHFSTDNHHLSLFVDLMARSSCPLTTVYFDSRLSKVNLVQFFTAAPHIADLSIDVGPKGLESLISILHATDGHLPNLFRLAVYAMSDVRDLLPDYPLLITMLQSRAQGFPVGESADSQRHTG
ncbi:hypothetical protein C8J57DRAFT_1215176 [Mycena rebaudengoi]|nr:hypothetical protein C8J57DRAFT_1215176 [Mycena rebaudengoi]